MDVVEDQDERLAPRQAFEESTDGPEALLRGPRPFSQPDQLGDPVGDAVGALDTVEERRDPASGLLGRVFVGDRGHSADGLCDRPVGDALAVGETASPQDERPIADLVEDLQDEARLPDARLAKDGDQPAGPFGDRSLERIDDRSQLGVSADHRGIQSPGVGLRSGDDLIEPIRRDRFGLSLRIDRIDGLRHDCVTDESIGRLADQDLAGSGRLLQPGRGVHRVAGHERLAPARVAGHHLSGVDPRPHRDLDTRGRLGGRGSAVERRSRISAAARTARRASSSWRRGMPNTAMIASPMNFSTVPPWCSSTSRIESK